MIKNTLKGPPGALSFLGILPMLIENKPRKDLLLTLNLPVKRSEGLPNQTCIHKTIIVTTVKTRMAVSVPPLDKDWETRS